ncbi:MAG: alkaline phosphatase D family protein, partial [Alphaproteobacteria bacterium]|nr:alkaline phosphatase D family protein [Alphaproteobacteria bacterium]
VAAAQAWFEYQPAHAVKRGDPDLNRFDAPKVADEKVAQFDADGLGAERNNHIAIHALKLYRSLRWGKNADLILTDNRSFRSYPAWNEDAASAFDNEDFAGAFPQEAVEILDAGKTYNNGKPPETIAFGEKHIPNFRKDKPAQTVLGRKQKAWFLAQLRASPAPWKIWGNSIGSLDARLDLQNVPETFGKWPGRDYGLLTLDDWSGYRSERGEILDFVKVNGITGVASVCGDRHAFYAGALSKNLPPQDYEPVALEFVGASVSSPGACEAFAANVKDDMKLHALLVRRPKGGAAEPMVNFSAMHGVRASLAYDSSGDLKAARAQSNPQVAPHLAFVDMGGHGYSVVRITPDTLETEFVCIPPPAERSGTDDGGPLAYRIRFTSKLWKPGEAPKLETHLMEAAPALWS